MRQKENLLEGELPLSKPKVILRKEGEVMYSE